MPRRNNRDRDQDRDHGHPSAAARNGRGRSPAGSARRHAPGAAFRCAGCGLDVPLDAPGTAHRNHCPSCLTSLHLDRRVPGDRAARCGGRMAAISLTVRADGEWLLIHQCGSCGALSANRIAGDDNPLPLLRLAMRPLADRRVPLRAALAI